MGIKASDLRTAKPHHPVTCFARDRFTAPHCSPNMGDHKPLICALPLSIFIPRLLPNARHRARPKHPPKATGLSNTTSTRVQAQLLLLAVCTLRPMPVLSVAMTGSRKPPFPAHAAVRTSPLMRFVSCAANVLEASSLLNLCQSIERRTERSRGGGAHGRAGGQKETTPIGLCQTRTSRTEEDYASKL